MTHAQSRVRLSAAHVGRLPAASRPAILPGDLGQGVVHVGLGAFARAHTVAHTEAAVHATGDTRWGVLGVTGRSRAVVDQLAPQDCLFSTLVRSGGSASARVCGALTGVSAADGGALAAALALPTTRVVTMTVTEAGYHLDAAGSLSWDDPDVRHDAEALRTGGRAVPRTAVGRLVQGLAERRRGGGPPVSLVSCDNLPDNGGTLRRAVLELCSRAQEGDALAAWVDDAVAFPATVVDRIVPRTTAADLAEVAELLGVEDRAAVVGEAYSSWVVQDRFAAGRPVWEAGGARFVDDVRPHEDAKLRLLNGGHSLLAHVGLLAGHRLVSAAAGDDVLAALLERYWRDEAVPTLAPSPDLDPAAVTGQLLTRWRDTGVAHRLEQIAGDGSLKLPQRVAPVLAAAAGDEGGGARAAALAVAAWARVLVLQRDDVGRPLDVRDPAAQRLHRTSAGDPVRAAVALPEVLGAAAPDDSARALVVQAARHLERHGALSAARAAA